MAATGTAKNSLWLSFSLFFWIFLAIAGLEVWVFYWVCWGFYCFGLLSFCSIFLVWDFVAKCIDCLGVFVNFFWVMDLLLELSMCV